MMNRRTLVGAAALAAAPAMVRSAQSTVAILREDWADAARGRALPVLIRLPAALAAPAPVAVVSHGLGGTRDGLAYLGEGLADGGYVVVHVQHPGTDASVWQGAANTRMAMMAAALDPARALDRLQDTAFILDELARRNASDPRLSGRLDLASLVMAGHSYGAWTVLHMLGERLPVEARGVRLPDPRLRAGVALSPIPPMGLTPAQAYAPVKAPVLYVTGTADQGWGVSDWRQRTLGYRNTTGPAALAVLDGAAHASFAGEAVAGAYWNQPTYQARTAQLSLRFLDMVLGRGGTGGDLRTGTGLSPQDEVETRGLV